MQPLLARASMCGVGKSLPPEKEKSPTPMSSTRMAMMFGRGGFVGVVVFVLVSAAEVCGEMRAMVRRVRARVMKDFGNMMGVRGGVASGWGVPGGRSLLVFSVDLWSTRL